MNSVESESFGLSPVSNDQSYRYKLNLDDDNISEGENDLEKRAHEHWKKVINAKDKVRSLMTDLGTSLYDLIAWKDIVFESPKSALCQQGLRDLLLITSKMYRRQINLYNMLNDMFTLLFDQDQEHESHNSSPKIKILQKEIDKLNEKCETEEQLKEFLYQQACDLGKDTMILQTKLHSTEQRKEYLENSREQSKKRINIWLAHDENTESCIAGESVARKMHLLLHLIEEYFTLLNWMENNAKKNVELNKLKDFLTEIKNSMSSLDGNLNASYTSNHAIKNSLVEGIESMEQIHTSIRHLETITDSAFFPEEEEEEEEDPDTTNYDEEQQILKEEESDVDNNYSAMKTVVCRSESRGDFPEVSPHNSPALDNRPLEELIRGALSEEGSLTPSPNPLGPSEKSINGPYKENDINTFLVESVNIEEQQKGIKTDLYNDIINDVNRNNEMNEVEVFFEEEHQNAYIDAIDIVHAMLEGSKSILVEFENTPSISENKISMANKKIHDTRQSTDLENDFPSMTPSEVKERTSFNREEMFDQKENKSSSPKDPSYSENDSEICETHYDDSNYDRVDENYNDVDHRDDINSDDQYLPKTNQWKEDSEISPEIKTPLNSNTAVLSEESHTNYSEDDKSEASQVREKIEDKPQFSWNEKNRNLSESNVRTRLSQDLYEMNEEPKVSVDCDSNSKTSSESIHEPVETYQPAINKNTTSNHNTNNKSPSLERHSHENLETDKDINIHQHPRYPKRRSNYHPTSTSDAPRVADVTTSASWKRRKEQIIEEERKKQERQLEALHMLSNSNTNYNPGYRSAASLALKHRQNYRKKSFLPDIYQHKKSDNYKTDEIKAEKPKSYQ